MIKKRACTAVAWPHTMVRGYHVYNLKLYFDHAEMVCPIVNSHSKEMR